MKKNSVTVLSFLMVFLLSFIIGCEKEEKQPEVPKQAVVQPTQENMGEKLFNEHCVICHPDSNKMNDITKPEDIINTIRNPKPGMPKFDKEEIPNDAAEAIAKYIFFSILSKK